MTDLLLSIIVLSAFALIAAGIYLLRRGGDRRKGWLMLAAAAVFLANVAIWTVPF